MSISATLYYEALSFTSTFSRPSETLPDRLVSKNPQYVIGSTRIMRDLICYRRTTITIISVTIMSANRLFIWYYIRYYIIKILTIYDQVRIGTRWDFILYIGDEVVRHACSCRRPVATATVCLHRTRVLGKRSKRVASAPNLYRRSKHCVCVVATGHSRQERMLV